jgi:hypothetical protein
MEWAGWSVYMAFEEGVVCMDAKTRPPAFHRTKGNAVR